MTSNYLWLPEKRLYLNMDKFAQVRTGMSDDNMVVYAIFPNNQVPVKYMGEDAAVISKWLFDNCVSYD